LFFTGPAVEAAGRVLNSREVIGFQGQVRGNVLTGLTFRGVRVVLPQADVRLPLARLDLRLWPLLRKEIVVETLTLDAPVVKLQKAARKAPPPAAAPREAAWTFVLADGRVKDGAVQIPGEGDATTVTNIGFRLSFADNILTVTNAAANLAASTVTAQGAVEIKPLRVDAQAAVTGPVEGHAQVHGTSDALAIDAGGVWEGVRFQARAALRDRKFWEGTAAFQNLDPARWAEQAADIGPLSGELSFEGEELALSSMTARTDFLVRAARLAAQGEASFADGAARWDAALSGVATGTWRGRWDTATRRLDTEARLKAALADLTPGEGAVALNAGAEGRWPRLAWRADARLTEGRWNNATAGRAAINAKGSGPEDLAFSARADIIDLRLGERPIDTTTVRLEGTLPGHRLTIDIRSKDVTLSAGGAGGLADGLWAMNWDRLSATSFQTWRAAKPFRTLVGKNRYALRDFAFTNGADRLYLDASLEDRTWETLKVGVDRFDTKPWADAGLWPLPVGGVFRLEAALAGPAASPVGAVSVRLSSATANGAALGSISGEGRLKPKVFYVRDLRWQAPSGALVVQGTVPVAMKGGLPDFSFHARAVDLDPAVFAGFLPGLKVEKGILQADINLKHAGGRLFTTGTARLAADRVLYSSAGARVEEITAEAVGDGGRVVISGVKGRAGKGTLHLWGTLEAQGPRLNLHTSRFLVDHPTGFKGLFDADLVFENTWAAPLLQGRVYVREGDFRPPEKKKKKEKKRPLDPPPETAKEPGPLAMDIDVTFDKNVWYKEAASAIEAKGDLNLRKDAGDAVRLFGSIETIRGRYVYLGRSFDIEEGRLGFLGTAPPDPDLNIQALYVARPSGTQIHLTITGTLRQPRLALSSEPPLTEEQIVQVLIFGQPLDQGDPSAAGGEEDRAAMAGSLLASYLLREARETPVFRALDLDVFELKTGDEAGVTVGRYLTSDLFISYEQTLGENGQRRVNAEYSLTPRWMLNGKTGTEGRYTVDLLFRYPL